MRHADEAAIVVGSEPFVGISYLEPIADWDSGFAVFSVPSDEAGEHDSGLVCLHCLIEGNPELGRGLDLARKRGVASLAESGEWVMGDLSRLDSG